MRWLRAGPDGEYTARSNGLTRRLLRIHVAPACVGSPPAEEVATLASHPGASVRQANDGVVEESAKQLEDSAAASKTGACAVRPVVCEAFRACSVVAFDSLRRLVAAADVVERMGDASQALPRARPRGDVVLEGFGFRPADESVRVAVTNAEDWSIILPVCLDV